MKILALSLSLALTASVVCLAPVRAQEKADTPNLGYASALHFLGVMGTQPGDSRLYVLLGSGFIRALSSGDPNVFVSGWLGAHPTARITPISRMLSTNRKTGQPSEIVYVWVEDGEHSLNVDMVRAGFFGGGTMYDMVDNLTGLDKLLENPKLADVRKQIEEERAAAPQDRADRLIADGDYKARMARVDAAESQARKEKRGIWSDAMKDERQAEGYP